MVTTQDSSADIIRLWLERSGHNTPLDIEIFLKSSSTPTNASGSRRRRTSNSTVADGWGGTPWPDPTWIPPPPPPAAGGAAPITAYVDFATHGKRQTLFHANSSTDVHSLSLLLFSGTVIPSLYPRMHSIRLSFLHQRIVPLLLLHNRNQEPASTGATLPSIT